MADPAAGRVAGIARVLGAAGLLPQLAAVTVLAWDGASGMAGQGLGIAMSVAFLYPALILSFVGGMWWSIAMRRGTGQARLAAVAVVPSLIAFALPGVMAVTGRFDGPLMLLGAVLIGTLLVDRQLVARGEAPDGWMRLRVPLSLGLGALTIVAGLLVR